MASGDDPKAPEDPAPRESSAADDLADGLDLMLRAAKKAVRSLDPRIEETARRAREKLSEFDPSVLGKMGRRAASKVDPQKIEQVAEDAGREIAGAVERVAQRIEDAIHGKAAHDAEQESTKADAAPAEAEREPGEPEASPPRKLRVDDT
jgi:septum formation inhibitor MinC